MRSEIEVLLFLGFGLMTVCGLGGMLFGMREEYYWSILRDDLRDADWKLLDSAMRSFSLRSPQLPRFTTAADARIRELEHTRHWKIRFVRLLLLGVVLVVLALAIAVLESPPVT